MAGQVSPGPEHPVPTRRRQLRYFFYGKHHRNGPSDDAQWCLSRDDEFSVFDEADDHDLSNSKGDLFGVLKRGDTTFDVLGTRGEQLAEFPVTPAGQPWHGYPLWPISRHDEGGRKSRPSSEALERMVETGVLTHKQKSRLLGGKLI